MKLVLICLLYASTCMGGSSGSLICVDAYQDQTNAYFTISTPTLSNNRYIAFCISSSGRMAFSDCFNLENVGGSYKVTARKATGHFTPTVISGTPLSNIVISQSGGNTIATFYRSVLKGSIWQNNIVVGSNTVIWAQGSQTGVDPTQHGATSSDRGSSTLSIPLNSPPATSSTFTASIATVNQAVITSTNNQQGQTVLTNAKSNAFTSNIVNTNNVQMTNAVMSDTPMNTPIKSSDSFATFEWKYTTNQPSTTIFSDMQCYANNILCISANTDATNAYFTMQTQNMIGFIGFCIGDAMTKADCFTIQNDGNSVKLVTRSSNDYVMPVEFTPNANEFKLISLTKGNSNTAIFSRLLNNTNTQWQNSIKIGSNPIIWAYGDLQNGQLLNHGDNRAEDYLFIGVQAQLATTTLQSTSATFIPLSLVNYCFSIICFDFKFQPESNLMTVKITMDGFGWGSLGLGANMVGDMIVVWVFNNEIIVSNRFGNGNVLPKYTPNDQLTVANPIITSTGYSVEITRPADASNDFSNSFYDQAFMAAFGAKVNSNDPSSDIPPHRLQDGKTFNKIVIQGQANKVDNTPMSNKMLHGLCFSIAWMILAPLGVFMAREKQAIGKRYF
eukprot:NODE_801_length_3816_cov_0.708905.p1 type:complete len:614 gc:universal NODE_801_length_3816_cov_0.708905:2365-524(-)